MRAKSDAPARSQRDDRQLDASAGCALALLRSPVRSHVLLQWRQLCGSLPRRRWLLSWRCRLSSKVTACAEHKCGANEYRQQADHRHSVRPSTPRPSGARFGPMKEGYAAADAGQAAAMGRQSAEFRMRGRRGSHRGYRATRHEGRGHLIENPGTIRSTPKLVNQGRIPRSPPGRPFSRFRRTRTPGAAP